MLDGLVDEAVRQNLDLQTAALRIEEARAQRGAAAAQGLPSVSGSGIGGRQRASKNGLASALAGGASQQGSSSGAGGPGRRAAPSPYSDLFEVGFDATWELDLWGKARRGVEAADASIVSAEQARGDAVVSLTAEVARTYLALRGAQRRRAIVRADIADEQQLLGADRLALEERLRVAGRRRAAAGAALGLAGAAAADRPGDRPGDEPPRAAAGAAARRARRAPGPAAAGRRRRCRRRCPSACPATCCAAGPTSSGARPTCTPPPPRWARPGRSCSRRSRSGGTAGFQSVHADSLTDWASRFWVGGAQVSIPIFEGGKLKAQIRTADAQMKEAALAWRGTVLAAYHDANNALVAYADEQRHAAPSPASSPMRAAPTP